MTDLLTNVVASIVGFVWLEEVFRVQTVAFLEQPLLLDQED